MERVVKFLNDEYQKMFFGVELGLKYEYLAHALLVADDLFARTAFEAEKFYGIGPKSDSSLPKLIDSVEDQLQVRNHSDLSEWMKKKIDDGREFARLYAPSKRQIF